MFENFMIVLPLIICIAAGYYFKRSGMLNSEGAAQMGRIVFRVVTPCAIFRLTMTLKAEDLTNVRFIAVFYSCIIISLLAVWFIGLFRKGTRRRRSTSYLMVLRTNNVYIGIPMIMMLWGEEMMSSYALLVALTMAAIEISSSLAALASVNDGIKASSLKYVLRSLFANPAVLSALAGTFWGLALARPLPRFIDLPMEIFSNLGTGLALITLGMRFEPKRLMHGLRTTWQDSAIRLILVPVIVWTAFRLFPTSPDLVRVAVLIMALPAAANTPSMAEDMGMDGKYAANAVIATTILSIFTLPLLLNTLLRV